jgi:hypothetical protein
MSKKEILLAVLAAVVLFSVIVLSQCAVGQAV